MSATPLNILFLCTGNSARSLIAEGVLRHLGDGLFKAFSAGSQPTGAPNPFALRVLAAHDIETGFAASKAWDIFAGDDAPVMDLIVTVCDNAAGETCPIWPGHPQVAHWGVVDPAAANGSDDEILAAFQTTYDEMSSRISALIAANPDTETIGDIARAIGAQAAGRS